MAAVTSSLWKVAQLAGASAYFQQMVKAACTLRGKEFSDRLLFSVASNQAIVSALTMEEGTSIDLSLMQLMVTRGADLDKAIMDAVTAYTPPAT